jgi:Protein of unknown function (DUF3089)
MDGRNATYLRWIAGLCAALIGLATFAAGYWREDIIRASLDPKQPFQTYTPPAAPDYASAGAWFLRPAAEGPQPLADVFFVHSTTFDGGRDWLGATSNAAANRLVEQVVLPNYAGPFAKVARVFAPRYRQASLFAYRLSQRDDAKEARSFAYGDVKRAFEVFLTHSRAGVPLVLVGVGQGAQLVGRLAREARQRPELLDRIAAVYLMEEVIPQDDFPPGGPLPLCSRREQARCVVAWISHGSGRPDRDHLLDRALVWTPEGDLARLEPRRPACVNPVTGGTGEETAARSANLGAANATGLKWPPAPRLLAAQVEAGCDDGLLSVSTPEAQELRPAQSWAEKLRPPGYNLFYADLAADVTARLSAWYGGPLAPGISRRIVVQPAPIHKIISR